jgi:hypothetical protein
MPDQVQNRKTRRAAAAIGKGKGIDETTPRYLADPKHPTLLPLEDRDLRTAEACQAIGCKKTRLFDLIAAGEVDSYLTGRCEKSPARRSSRGASASSPKLNLAQGRRTIMSYGAAGRPGLRRNCFVRRSSSGAEAVH